MIRNAKRVANLIHQLDEDGVYYLEVESFKEDVSSDFGIGEYFIPVELGTPPTPQYLVIDTRSDVVPNQCHFQCLQLFIEALKVYQALLE